MRWSKASKLVSCICVAMMLILTLNVVVNKTAAMGSNDEGALKESSLYQYSETDRLTLSLKGAHIPSIARAFDGSLHVVWVDEAIEGQKVMWKHSLDGGRTYSSDFVISPGFKSISGISIDCSPCDGTIAITMEEGGRIYLLLSEDQGDTWGDWYLLDRGHDAKVQLVNGQTAIIGFFKEVEGVESYVLARLALSGDTIYKATGLAALAVQGPSTFLVAGWDISYALSISTPDSAVVYGQMRIDGKTRVEPTLVTKLGKSIINDIDICLVKGKPLLAWSMSSSESSTISVANYLGNESAWVVVEVEKVLATINHISMASTPNGAFISFENESKESKTISGLEVSTNGERHSQTYCISSTEDSASNPSVVTGPSGEVHCIWERSNSGKSDIYRSSDVLFRLPDPERLKRFLDSIGDAAFLDAKQKAVNDFRETLKALIAAKNDANEAVQKEFIIELRALLDSQPPSVGLFSNSAIEVLVCEQLSSMDNILRGRASVESFCPTEQLLGAATKSLDPPPPDPMPIAGPWPNNITAISAVVYWGQVPVLPPYENADLFLEYWQYPSGTHYQVFGSPCPDPPGYDPSYEYSVVSLANLVPGTRYWCKVLGIPNYPETNFWTLPVAVGNVVGRAESPTEADIRWTSTVLATTKVYYGLTSSYGSVATSSEGAYHHVRLSELSPNTVYHYKVESKYLGDQTKFASSGDLTFITNVTIYDLSVAPGFSSATIHWTTNMNATCVVDYGLNSSYLYSAAVEGGGKDHTVTISGLNASLMYNCRLRSVYISNSQYFASNYTSFWSTDLQVTDLVAKVGADNVVFQWNTTDNATGEVFYGTSPSNLNQHKVADNGTEHYAIIENLTKQTHYYYRILSKFIYDDSVNDSANGDVITANYAISAIKSTLISKNPNGTYNVLATWLSNFFGTSKVTHSTNNNFPPGSTYYAFGNETRQHAVRLSNLAGNTKFYYKVESKPVNDAPAPALVSSVYNFETRVYIFSLSASVGSSLTSCTISWQTNVAATTVLRYGTTSSLRYVVIGSSGTSHSVTLTGLEPLKTYYYQAESNYSYFGNIIPATSDIQYFITGQLTISDLEVSSITLTSAKITWYTNLYSESYVEFAKCSKNQAPNVWHTGGYARLSAACTYVGSGRYRNTVTLSGLVENSTYTYKVQSTARDNSMLTKWTSFSEFITRPMMIISNLKWTSNDASVTITWSTNWESNSRVDYGLNASYPYTAYGYDGMTHSVTITSLISNTLYHFRVSSTKLDQSLSGQSADTVFSTLALMVHSIANGSLTTSSFTISWTSNFNAYGRLEYGTTPSYGSSMNEFPYSQRTSHSVTAAGLQANTLYYFRVVSISGSNSSDIATSGCHTVRTYAGENDAGRMVDAGNAFASAMPILSCSFFGNLTSSSDIKDFYQFYAFVGQRINVTLTVPSGGNYNLYLYDQGGVARANSTKSGSSSETVSATTASEGNWRFEVRWISGSGKRQYSATLHIYEAANTFTLDVGVTGDNYTNGHMPGLMLCNCTGWGPKLSDPTRRAGVSGSGFLLTLDNEVQSRDYQLTVRYWSSSNVVVSVFAGGGWTNLTTLPGRSDWSTHSFIVNSIYLYDYLPYTQGTNVRFNFMGAPLELDTIVAIATTSSQGINDSGSGNTMAKADLPCYRLESNWVVKDWLANGTSGATIKISIPRSDISYMLTFTYAGSTDGIEVEQQSSSGYKSIGRLHKFGQEASIVLNREWYYDVDTSASAPGIDIRIRLKSSLSELSSISITPALYCTDVGAEYDDYTSSHTPGINIFTNGEWGTRLNGNGRTYRTSTANANFYLNAPLSETPYVLTISYKTNNQTLLRQYNYSQGAQDYWVELGSLVADGQWHTSSFTTRSELYRDYVIGGDLNVLFELTGSTTVDWINASADEDNDTLSTYEEGMRSCENDTTVRDGSFTKSFSCWETGTYSVTLDMLLVAHRYFDKGSGETYYEPVFDFISLDGVPKKTCGTYSRNSLKCTITQYLTKGQHVLSLVAIGYGDSKVNGIVIENTYSLNPSSADSDSDGLTESQEIALGTNPSVADTDGDGLADGQERYSAMYSTDGAKGIVEDTQGGVHTTQVLEVQGVVGPIDHIYAHVAIVHPRIGDLRVNLVSPSSQYAYLFYQPGNSTANLFTTFDLLDYFSPDAFRSDGDWTLQVMDLVSGQQGRLEHFRIQVDGRTELLNPDSDGDGVLDGEEVDLGADGWVTNPRLADTDGDGLTDSVEVNGFTSTLKRSDPTRADTDDDGFIDSVDVEPTGDAILQVTIDKLFRPSDEYYSPVFFTVEADGWHYSTARTPTDTPNSWATVGLRYYVDIWDSNTTASIRVRAWDENGGGDTEIDICPGAAKQFEGSYSILYNRWDDQWGTWVIDSNGKGDGYDADQDARLVVQVRTVVREKARTIVVNATDYGLDVVKEGEEYRFSGDDQVYMFYLNCSSASAHFVQGLNVVLLPRALALESKINSTLYDLQGAGVDNPLRGASLRTPTSSGDCSGHIAAVISKNLTGDEAEELLGMMTHNSTNARIGNSLVVPSTMALYLMHLPVDVVSNIPVLDVVNSPTGAQPRSFWDYLFDTLIGIADFLWRGLVATLQFMLYVALAMTGIGLIIYILCDPGVQAAISQAINKIVDAFIAMMTWILDFIFDMACIMFGPVLSAITAATDPYCAKVMTSSKTVESEIQATGAPSARSKNSLSESLLGPLYDILGGVVLVIAALFILIKVFTVGCSFIVSAVIGIIVSILIAGAISLFQLAFDEEATTPIDYIASWLKAYIAGNCQNASARNGVICIIEGSCEVLGMFICAGRAVWEDTIPGISEGAVKGIILSLLGIAISIYSAATGAIGAMAIGWMLSFIGLYDSIIALSKFGRDEHAKELVITALAISTCSFVTTSFELLSALSEEND